MMLKFTAGFFNTLMIVEILTLSCALHVTEFMLFCSLFKPCSVCSNVQYSTLINRNFEKSSYCHVEGCY